MFHDFVGDTNINDRNSIHTHMVDLVLGAFFFAMRACEYSLTPRPGKTKRVTIGDLKFRDQDRQILQITDPLLQSKAQFVTITFQDQKNATKMDARSHQRSGHDVLCPVLRFASAVRRLVTTFPAWSLDTPLSAVYLATRVTHIDSDLIRNTMRRVCRTRGRGPLRFDFDASEIGNKSIRSGAAMALSLNDHSPYKIMILGRWASDAFLAYIRPQVLEWTNNMSQDMVNFNEFMEVSHRAPSSATSPRQRRRLAPSFDGRNSTTILPQFHLNH